MVDTLFADVSYYQDPVDDSYPHPWFSFRSNDGTFQDPNFWTNYAWACGAVDSGQIVGFHVYYVDRGDSASADTHWDMITAAGGPHPMQATLIDVETWGGEMSGNHSGALNSAREKLIGRYGGNRARVFAYANEGDRNELWPDYGDTKWIIANYSTCPDLPDMIAHQYSSSEPCDPFGPCDGNSANGYTPDQWAAELGLATAPAGDDMPDQYVFSGVKPITLTAGGWQTLDWNDTNDPGSSGMSAVISGRYYVATLDVTFDTLPPDGNAYLRYTCVDKSSYAQQSASAIAEQRGTGGTTSLTLTRAAYCPKSQYLRARVAATQNCKVTAATWSVLWW